MNKASDLFLQCLQQQGVSIIYGVPGEENADLMISLLDSKIDFISTRHEQTASFMAEMHGRLTGIPGVCLATLGPGATNLLTGVAQANMDHAPLIAIIGQADSQRLHKESHQNMDSLSMYKSVTKWATSIRDADTIPEVIAKAFKIATEGRPGAVLIELPEDIASHNTEAKPLKPFSHANHGGCSEQSLQDIAQLIAQSKKPILLVGDGAVREECDAELKQLLDKTQIYSAHTFMGKGAVSHQYQRSLHCVGLGFKDVVLEAFEQADLVICVGYHMVEYPPQRWNIGCEKNVVHLDVAPAEIDTHYAPEIECVGDIKLILQQLNNILSEKHCKKQDYLATQQRNIEHHVRQDQADDSFPMKPKRILQDIRSQLADEDILVSDVGAHKMWVARQYGARQSKTCFISNGFCSMGGSIPGAIEAKRLFPHKNVVAVCGDGGLMMSIQALATAVELNTPIVVVCWEDDYYGLIKWKQEMHYDTSSHVKLYNPNLAQLAASFGCHAEPIKTSDALIPALQQALQRNQPSVLIVPVDYNENMKLFSDLRQRDQQLSTKEAV